MKQERETRLPTAIEMAWLAAGSVWSVIPHIKQCDVRNWTDDVYFQRGQSYYKQGAIDDQRKHGMTLKSKCAGSQAALCLRELRDIYRQLSETESWQKLIMDVRDRHKRLPALQDELNQL